MTVARQHVNGHGICHGGLIFTLADSAFACACNSYNQRTVAQHATIDLRRPGKARRPADGLGEGVSRNGRSGLYDVAVTNQDGALVAAFRGASRTLAGEHFRPAEGRTNDAGSAPRPGDLEPIETRLARRARGAAAQRLKWSLQHAYDNVPFYRRRLRRGRRAPRRLLGRSPTWPSSRSRPRTTCATTTRSACSRCRASRWCASMPPPAPPASRPWSATPGATSTPGPTLMARSIRAAGGRPGDIVHVAYGYGLFTGGLGAHYGAERLGCTVVPVVGGMTERQVQLIDDFGPTSSWSRRPTCWRSSTNSERQGLDPRESSLAGRHLRRRAVDQRHARRNRARLRHGRRRHLRPVGGDGPGRRQRMRRDQGRPAHLGRPFLSRDRRPGDRRGAARRRARRAGVHLPDQGGAARHPLPHARPHPAAAGHRAHACGAWRRSPAAPTT